MHKSQGSVARLLSAAVLAFLPATLAFGETLIADTGTPLSDPIMARGASAQSNPVSATDGRDFLLVWTDWRSGIAAIYATRVSAAGAALDPEGILLSDPNEPADEPSVAWTGTSYIVVWQQAGCRFQRIAPDGHLEGFTQAVFAGPCSRPQVAVSGGRPIVVARRGYTGLEVAAIEDTWPFVRTVTEVRGAWSGVIACSESDCLLAWQGYRSVMGRYLGLRGEHVELQDRLLAAEAIDPVIAATGDRFLLVWRDWSDRDSRSSRLWARELQPTLESPPFVVTQTDQPAILDAAVTPSGKGFLVAWSQYRQKVPLDERPGLRADDVAQERAPKIELRARRIGAGETAIGEAELTIASSNVAYRPVTVASNGVTHLGGWIEESNGKIAADVMHAGTSRSRVAVTRSATIQGEPQVVNCGDHLLVVWSEEFRGDGTVAIMARRFRLSGEALDLHPIVIAEAGRNQRQATAAFDGQSYLVAWSDNGRVYAREFHRDGTLAPDVLVLSSDGALGQQPDVVATDRGFAVLYGEGDGRHPQLILTRVDAGMVIERTTIVRYHDRDYALGWNGSELIVVWGEGSQRIYAARLTPGGNLLDPEPILVGFGPSIGGPEILCEAAECVVAWSDAGIKTAAVIGGSSWNITELIRDFGDYQSPPRDRYGATLVRAEGEFRLISYDSHGILHSRSLRDGVASPETTIGEVTNGIGGHSLSYTPNGLAIVDARPVFGPGYAGARRLFLRYLVK